MSNRLALRTPVRNTKTKCTGIIAGIQTNPDCYLIKLDDETLKPEDALTFWDVQDTRKRRITKKAA